MDSFDDRFGPAEFPVSRRLELSRVSLSPTLSMVEASGDIDILNVAEFDSCLRAATDSLGVGGRLVVDLAGVSFLAVCGVRSLLEVDRLVAKRGQKARFVVTTEPVRLPLQVLGLFEQFAVFTSRADATVA
ncbi:STAS domain-containing protein [Pseudonocardia halophobica]|uniref:STAS domain-containing protein n=1 Tax=Pseudonocardia halophobica TaxID=29401 RepID=UPI003D8B2D8C